MDKYYVKDTDTCSIMVVYSPDSSDDISETGLHGSYDNWTSVIDIVSKELSHGQFTATVPFKSRREFIFVIYVKYTDGTQVWDNNHGRNYKMRIN